MKRSDLVTAICLFFFSLAVYIRTLAPGLLYGDSAEFQTIGYTMGMGHPTGYAIYVFLAKIFTFLPIGEIAYRVNLLSAVSAAGTVTLIYLIVRSLDASAVAAVFACLSLAFTPIFWQYATFAEVYTPSAACLAFIVFAMIRWKYTNHRGWLFIGGVSGGLSLGLHASVALAAPAVLVYLILSNGPKGVSFRRTTKYAVMGALAGMLVSMLAFTLLDQRDSPAGYYNAVVMPSLSVWGMTSTDFDSIVERFSFLFFPPQFRGQFFALPLEETLHRMENFARDYVILLLFSLAGILSCFSPILKRTAGSSAAQGWFLLIALLSFATFGFTYKDQSFFVYQVPSILMLVILGGLGFQWLLDKVSSLPRFRTFTAAVIILLCYAAGPGYAAVKLPQAWRERIPPGLKEWERFNYQFPGASRLQAEKIVNRIEDNAIVFTDWNRIYGLYYVAHVLKGRIGIDFHQVNPQGFQYLPADSLMAYIEENMDRRPIYFTRYPAFLEADYQITAMRSDLFQIRKK